MNQNFSKKFLDELKNFSTLSENFFNSVVDEVSSLDLSNDLKELFILNRLRAYEKEVLENTEKESLEKNIKHYYVEPVESVFILSDGELPYFKDDMATMEFPIFALKTQDTNTVKYEFENKKIIIRPLAGLGRATIFDKDIWIFIISRLMEAKFKKIKIERTVEFTAKDFFNKTSKNRGGKQYKNLKDSLNRLMGTQIETNIETNKQRIARGFGLLDSWEIVESGKRLNDEVPVRLRVTVPDWLFNAIQGNEILQINPDYFRLKRPLDRRIYEIARKHCGRQEFFKIGLENLWNKSGSRSNLRRFKHSILTLIDSQPLPDYFIELNQKTNVITFSRKLESVIYELVRKLCNSKGEWEISLNELYELSASRLDSSKFKENIILLIQNQQLPDYFIEINEKTNIITFKLKTDTNH